MQSGNVARTISTERLSEQIYERLREAIIDGTLTPGERLSIKDLANQFEVSTTPVRDALKFLEADSLVESIPRRGAFVTQLSRSEIQEIFHIRQILACAALERLGEVSDETIQRLQQIGVEMKALPRPVAQADDYLELHEEFHRLIISMLGSRRVSEFYETLGWSVQLARVTTRTESGSVRGKLQEHLPILEAIVERDPVRAKQAMRNHLRNAEEDLLREIPPNDV